MKAEYKTFHSQFGEDKWLFENIELPDNGVFVDVGAGHPRDISNTYFFERNGWTGICIDPDPRQVEALKKERKQVVKCAVGTREGLFDFFLAPHPDLSSLKAPKQRKDIILSKVSRLDKICIESNIKCIDLLSIDAEGMDLDVLQSMGNLRPYIVIVEYRAMENVHEQELRDFFANLPYRLAYRTSANLIFVRTAQAQTLFS